MMIKNNRFYPDFFPIFENEPTKDRFSIVSTPQKGEGVISCVDLSEDQIVCRFTGVLSGEITLFTLQMKNGSHLHDPFFMGKILHCCEPNMLCDMETQTFHAVRPIKQGDFLTMDYETTESQLFRSFHCGCGSSQCRGLIAGKNYSPAKLQVLNSDESFLHVG